jgi:hypothetical protein
MLTGGGFNQDAYTHPLPFCVLDAAPRAYAAENLADWTPAAKPWIYE